MKISVEALRFGGPRGQFDRSLEIQLVRFDPSATSFREKLSGGMCKVDTYGGRGLIRKFAVPSLVLIFFWDGYY